MKYLKKYSWYDLAETVKKIQPEFYDVLNELSPSDDYSLYLGRYPYGALILDKGVFQIVNDKEQLVPLHDNSIPSSIKNDLDYNRTIPMGMTTENSIETFFIVDGRTIPSSFYTPGDMISLWRVLEGDCSYQEGPLWSISSGCRTLCMLPKITDKTRHEILRRKYNLKQPVPNSLSAQQPIFQSLATSKEFTQPWHSELIYFSKKWFEHRNDKTWASFYQFILNKAWLDSAFKRNQFIFDFAFSLAQKNKNLKPNPYLADTVKHLIGIGTGGMPGLTPAINNIAAPIEGLQKAYIEDYGLKKYHPTIMHLHHFSLAQPTPVYYSLEMPTTTIFSPRSSRASSKMVDMRDLRHILSTFLSEILKANLQIEKTPLFNLANSVEYSFYHSGQDQYNEIQPVTSLADKDANFRKMLSPAKGLEFPKFSAFFNGCISIKKS